MVKVLTLKENKIKDKAVDRKKIFNRYILISWAKFCQWLNDGNWFLKIIICHALPLELSNYHLLRTMKIVSIFWGLGIEEGWKKEKVNFIPNFTE